MNAKTKKILKVVAVILLVMLALTMISQPVFAATKGINPGNLTPDYSKGNTAGIQEKAQRIMGLIRNIAVVAGVIVLMIIGVKFILGSAEEKAEYKKSLMPLVIGVIIVMVAAQIMAMVVSFIE